MIITLKLEKDEAQVALNCIAISTQRNALGLLAQPLLDKIKAQIKEQTPEEDVEK